MAGPASKTAGRLAACPVCGELPEQRVCGLRHDDYLSLLGQTRSASKKYLCARCGLLIAHPRLTESQARRIYARVIHRGDPSDDYVFWKNLKAKRDYAWLNRALAEAAFGGQLRILEAGCSEGAFLEVARDQGHRVFGIEPSAYTRYARRTRKVAVVRGSFQDRPFKAASMDVVVALRVLEHLVSPLGFLAAARDVLREGGCLYLQVPSFESPEGWPKAFWGGHHVTLFSTYGLCKMVDAAGFVIEKAASENGASVLARKTEGAVDNSAILAEAGSQLPTFTRIRANFLLHRLRTALHPNYLRARLSRLLEKVKSRRE